MPAPSFANHPAALGGVSNGFLPEALESEVCRIYARSPLYGLRHPLEAGRLHWAQYEALPVLSKREIVERGHRVFFSDYREVERGLQEKRYEYESTSGTTQGPMTVIMEDGWWNAQTERAYLASPLLRPFVGRPYRKCILAPVGCSSNLCPYEDHPFPHRYFDGVVYLNLSSDPFVFPEGEWDRIVRELQAVQPEVIEGEPVYLSLLARAVARRHVQVPSVKAVILTYGKASLVHSRRIAEVFPAPQVDLYGSTEAGYLFVGEAFKDDLQVVDANAFIELVPWREALPEVFQIHVTTRGREAMPLLRYHTGDIVRRLPTGFRILGRERDVYFREDGGLVSASEVDAALPAGFVAWHYALQQTGERRWDFHYVADQTADHGPLEAALSAVLGARVNAFRRRVIPPAASGKFALLKPLVR
ncbi:MAG TPA: CoF synthetase [Opitutaceae bacterium]|nr:MAG: AMP-binding enzyme [Verrucomicrobia bacterium ADurb.Bin122]HOD46955.1 CoF synthetase [Opitutaceae bacterium]HOY54283.1 CoF synthetase [Opitutaceae bacterium]HPG17109.1 CoF synthetase [Opitutaceae bacterium]HPN99206.1 CoF synthetase [Opitutaceae bacterium]